MRVFTIAVPSSVALLLVMHAPWLEGAPPATAPAATAPSTSAPVERGQQALREVVWQTFEKLAAGDAAAKELVVLRDEEDAEVIDALLEDMRAVERLRSAMAIATNARAASDAETAKALADTRGSIMRGTVTIDGEQATLTHASPELEQGAAVRPVTVHASRVGGRWRVDVLRALNLREPAARAESLRYMRLRAKAQDALAAQFREGKLKNPAAVDYLLRLEMMRMEANEAAQRPATTAAAARKPAATTSAPTERKPKAAASDPPAPGEVRRIITDGRVAAVAFSPDGKLLVSGARLAERSLRMWNAASGEVVRDFDTPPDLALQVVDVKWTADGREVVTCGVTFKKAEVRELIDAGQGSRMVERLEPVDFAIRVWDVKSGRPQREMSGHTAAVFRLALSREGATLASASADGTVRVWDLSSGKETLKIDAVTKGDFAYGIDFFPNGKELASFGSDNVVRVFETSSGKELRRWTIERGTYEVAISPDGRRAACARLMAVQLFDAVAGAAEGALMFTPDAGLLSNINALAWTPDGAKLVAADGMEEDPEGPAPIGFAFERNQSLRIWDASTGKQLAKFRGHVNAINDMTVAPDGKTVVSASADGSIRFWKIPQ